VRLGTVISLPLLHDNAEKAQNKGERESEKGEEDTMRNDVQCPAESRVETLSTRVSCRESRVETQSFES